MRRMVVDLGTGLIDQLLLLITTFVLSAVTNRTSRARRTSQRGALATTGIGVANWNNNLLTPQGSIQWMRKRNGKSITRILEAASR